MHARTHTHTHTHACTHTHTHTHTCTDQMTHIRPSHSHHWHLSVCPVMAPRLVCQHSRNWCQVPVAKMWQLPSCQHLWQIADHAGAFYGIQKDGNHRLQYQDCTEAIHSHSTITSHRLSCLWLPHIWSPYKAYGRQVTCSICTHELNCHLLPTDTWHWLSLCWCMSLGVMVGWMLRCRWSPHWHLMCIMCYACAPYTLKSDWHSQQDRDYCLIFLNYLAYCPFFIHS